MITGKRKPKETLTRAQAMKTVNKVCKKIAAVAQEIKKDLGPDRITRAALMAEAQAKGIKYFRILNKEELEQVLNRKRHDDQVAIDVITSKAQARWKSGWGTRKKEVASV